MFVILMQKHQFILLFTHVAPLNTQPSLTLTGHVCLNVDFVLSPNVALAWKFDLPEPEGTWRSLKEPVGAWRRRKESDEHEGIWRSLKGPEGTISTLQRCWWRHLNLVWMWAMHNSRMRSCCVCSHRCHMLVTWKGSWTPVQKNNEWMWKQPIGNKNMKGSPSFSVILTCF